MPDYRFQLLPRGAAVRFEEPVTAADDEEARALAEMRLLLGETFVDVTVIRDGVAAFRVQRDARPANGGPMHRRPDAERTA